MEYKYKKLNVDMYTDSLYKDGLQKSKLLTQDEIKNTILNIGVFKLKGYVRAFRGKLSKYSIDDLFELYRIDRGISSNMFTLSSKIEVRLKSCLIEATYKLTDNPFFYLLKNSYIEDFTVHSESLYDWEARHAKQKQKDEEYLHYRDYYLANYDFDENKEKYLSNQKLIQLDQKLNINYPPFHYFVENMTLGSLIKMLSKLTLDNKSILKLVANRFKILNPTVFLAYLLRLKEVRNRCAHNGRLFNRNYRGVKAMGDYKEIRKDIYNHRLLDVYYTLNFLLDDVDMIKNGDDLKNKFILENLRLVDTEMEHFIMDCIRKR